MQHKTLVKNFFFLNYFKFKYMHVCCISTSSFIIIINKKMWLVSNRRSSLKDWNSLYCCKDEKRSFKMVQSCLDERSLRNSKLVLVKELKKDEIKTKNHMVGKHKQVS